MPTSVRRRISTRRLQTFHFLSGEHWIKDRRPAARGGWACGGNAATCRRGWILTLFGIALWLTPQLALGQTSWQFDKIEDSVSKIRIVGDRYPPEEQSRISR